MHLKAGGEAKEDRGLREGGGGEERESGGGWGGMMLQWLCAQKSPADAAEEEGVLDWSKSDQWKPLRAFNWNIRYYINTSV